MREALSQLTVMRSPGAPALREILLKPAEALGYHYDDPGLVDEVLAAVQGKPACLPLLQFATRKMWDHRDRDKKLLCRTVYQEMGGVAGALADHADGVLQGLSANQVQVAREMLLRLVTPEGTRRILGWNDVVHGLGPEAEEILNRLIHSRLVLVGKGRGDDSVEAELELVHESLVHRWYRLARWFDESRDKLAMLEDLSQAAELWEKRGCPEQEVWQGPALQDAEEIARRSSPAIPERVQRFLQVSRQREDRRVRRRRLIQVAGFTLLCAVAFGATVFAWALADKEREATGQRDRAQAQRLQARSRSAEAQREAALAALLRDDPYEARAKLRASLETEDSAQARALWLRLTTTPLVWKKELGAAVYDLAISRDGRSLAAACQDRTVYLFDMQTHRVRFLRGHRDQVYGIAFSPGGGHLATGTWGGEVGLWDLSTGGLKLLRGHTGKVHGLAFSPDGRWLASSSYDATVRLWRVADGTARVLSGHAARTYSVAFSPDGQRLASASWDGTVRIWDRDSGRTLRVLRGHDGKVMAVTFAPGGAIATGGSDGTVRIWDPNGKPRRVLSGHQGPVHSVAYNAAGRLLASGGYDGTVRIWDAASGRQLDRLEGHKGWVLRVAFSPEEDVLASASMDRTLRLWNLAYSSHRRPRGHGARVFGLAVSPDGELLASGGWDNVIRLWNLDDGTLRRVLSGHTSGVFSVAFSPDGRTLASGSWDKTVRLWDLDRGTLRHRLDGHEAEVSTTVFSPDGRLLASGSWDRTIRLWDVQAGRTVALLSGHEGAVYDLCFAPDGRRLASASADRTARLWSVPGRRQVRLLSGHEGPVYGVSFAPDGKTLVSGSGDGTVRRWRGPGWQGEILGKHPGRVYHLAFHPTGRLVGAPCADGTAFLWPTAGGAPTRLVGHHAEVNFLRFTADGRLAITSSDDGTIRTWRVDSGLPHWRAPLLLPSPPRIFTHRGWRRLDTGRTASVGPGKWRRAVEGLAVAGDSSADGRLVAVVTAKGELQLWDIRLDRLLYQRPVGSGARDPQLLPDGSVALIAGGKAQLVDRAGRARSLAAEATAVSWQDGALLVTTRRQILVLDERGRRKSTHSSDIGATAAVRVKGWLAVGNQDGNVELTHVGGGVSKTLKNVPASAVTRMLGGPMDTLVVGYANGLVGIWSLETDDRLLEVFLHGPVQQLHLEGGRLYAVTALGDYAVRDLRVFVQGYCTLLRRVWQGVAAVWEGGRPVVRSPPAGHRCR